VGAERNPSPRGAERSDQGGWERAVEQALDMDEIRTAGTPDDVRHREGNEAGRGRCLSHPVRQRSIPFHAWADLERVDLDLGIGRRVQRHRDTGLAESKRKS
jgi:hypothetical protein